MKNFERRLEKLERQFMLSREAILRNQKMCEQIVRGRERWRKYRELHGISELSDEGLPPKKVHTSHGLQRVVDELHEARDRCRLRSLRDGLVRPSGLHAEGDNSCQ
jgi:hypothetical protein